ncbi:hypothetical protein [Streptomyces tanashiensis]|uniref:hypothetical protein n=1 Tax=Streptomyces tanashiensis TaxID=67367 RepID=UPI00167A0249|nr:hypothetical protein [Streptomyces tanashiensis]
MSLTTYVGGGLGALALFGDLAKDVLNECVWLRAIFFTLVFLGAALLVHARQSAEWFLIEVERGNKTASDASSEPFKSYKLATVAAAASGGILVAASWYVATK